MKEPNETSKCDAYAHRKKTMTLDNTKAGAMFVRVKGKSIRHVEKHPGVAMDFWYRDTEADHDFDIRDFTAPMLGDTSRDAVLRGNSAAHMAAIQHAVNACYDLKLRDIP